MRTEQFTIPRRWFSSLPPITVEIACAADTPAGVRLGLAVMVAFGQKPDLRGAVLRGADLSGADLRGAVLRDAVLRGEKVSRLFARIDRDDGYTFLALELEAGGVKIEAGCRWLTIPEFRAHVAAEYPDTPKATETLWILAAIEQRAADLGIALEAEQVPA